MRDQTIEVICVILPDGSTHFLPLDPQDGTVPDTRAVSTRWKESLTPEKQAIYEQANPTPTGAYARMTMLAHDYWAISPTRRGPVT